MNVPKLDPEDFFWQQIQDRPSDPIPRLLYADWCDENDRPVMSIVQRWLAATGRRPDPRKSCCWRWVTESEALRHPLPWSATLPDALFWWIGPGTVEGEYGFEEDRAHFVSLREAEETLAKAWVEATRRRTFRRSWKPEFGSAANAIPVPVAETQFFLVPEDKLELGIRIFRWCFLLGLAVMVLLALIGFGSNRDHRYWDLLK
jgi:uncharacterized protein (TIGR02996 family)